MNENEHKSNGGPRAGSLFSFLKQPAEDLPPPQPPAQQAVRPAGPSPEVAGLKIRIAEMEEKLRRMENPASPGAVPADAVTRLPELERRLAALENVPVPKQPEARRPEDGSKYIQMIGKAEAALLALLESDRRKAGETAAAMEEKLGRLEADFNAAGGVIAELKAKLEEALSALEYLNSYGQAAGRMEAERNAASATLLERSLRELKDALEPRLCAAEKAVAETGENERRRGEAGLGALKDFRDVLDVYGRELRQVRDGAEAQAAAIKEALGSMNNLLSAEGEKRDEAAALAATQLAEFKKEICGEQVELRRGMEAFNKFADEAGEKAAAQEKIFKETIARLDSDLAEERGRREEEAEATASRLAELKSEIDGGQAELRYGMAAFKKVADEAGEKAAAQEKIFKETIARLDSDLSEERGRREEEGAATSSRLAGLERALAGQLSDATAALSELRPGAEVLKGAMAADREKMEILERALKENSKYLKSLLSEEGTRHEGAVAGLLARLTGLEQMLAEDRGGAAVAAVEWQRSAAGLREEMSALKSEIAGVAETAFRDARARLEGVAARTREEILAAAREELLSLEPQLKAAESEVKAAQKTAFLAFEKCDKLDRSMAYIEQKSASLERRYYRYIEEDPAKPASNA